MHDRRLRGLAALLLLLAGCRSFEAVPERAPRWDEVARDVVAVADDPSADALVLRTITGERTEPASARLDWPTLVDVPAHAWAQVTAARGLRWFLHGQWGGMRPAPGAFERSPSEIAWSLPPFAVVSGVLLETPLFGPWQGVPRALAIIAQPPSPTGPSDLLSSPKAPPLVPDHALVMGRGPFTYAVWPGHAVFLGADVAPTPIALSTLRPQAVRPAVCPDGTKGAIAVTDEARPAIAIVLGARVVEVIALLAPPLAVHLADGHLYVESAGTLGTRELHRWNQPVCAKGGPTAREQSVLRHRDGLQIRIEELVAEEGSLVEAVDRLELLHVDGLRDLPSTPLPSVAALVQRARERLVIARHVASEEEQPLLAWAIDRRARWLDGKAVELHAPPLRIAVEAPSIPPAVIGEVLARHQSFERVASCPAAPADQVPCLSFLLEKATDTARAELAASLDRAMRAQAEEVLAAREDCLEENAIVIVDGPTGAASRFACDREAAAPFAELAVARHRLGEAGAWTLAAELGDGEKLEASLTPASAEPAVVLAHALEATLRARGRLDLALARAERTPAAWSQSLRTLLWRGPASDPEVLRILDGEGRWRSAAGAPDR